MAIFKLICILLLDNIFIHLTKSYETSGSLIRFHQSSHNYIMLWIFSILFTSNDLYVIIFNDMSFCFEIFYKNWYSSFTFFISSLLLSKIFTIWSIFSKLISTFYWLSLFTTFVSIFLSIIYVLSFSFNFESYSG